MSIAQRRQRPPRHIGLMGNVSPQNEPILDFLFSDFQDALAAYARLSDTAVPLMTAIQSSKVENAPHFDTAVLGVYVHTPEEALSAFSSLCLSMKASEALVDERRVYGIICVEEDGDYAAQFSQQCRLLCEQANLTWCGALVIARANALAAHRGRPRLGFWRRPTSEALDRFIGAVRSGLSISESQALAGAVIDADDTISARARRVPLPRHP